MGRRRPAQPLPSHIRSSLHAAVPAAQLDLHGMRREEALTRVDGFLDTWQRRGGGAVLRIITGKGNRSDGEPVLLHAVGDRLREQLGGPVEDLARDAGGGGWLVRMK